MKEPLLVYCAGAYSADNVIEMLGNLRRGLRMSYEVLVAGHHPYVPWADLLLHMFGPIDVETCYTWSMAFLERCDCVLVNPRGLGRSRGAKAEIIRATELGIPVFYCLADLLSEEGLTPIIRRKQGS